MIFRIYHETLGGHVHMRMFAGTHDGALGKCGDLTMRTEEFWDFLSRFGRDGQIEFRTEDNKRSVICRAKGGEVGAIGECLKCGAEQGIACRLANAEA
jgi:hypothetical protein